LKVLAGTFSLCLFNDFLLVLLTLLISLKSKEVVGLYHRHLRRYIINDVYHQLCLPPMLVLFVATAKIVAIKAHLSALSPCLYCQPTCIASLLALSACLPCLSALSACMLCQPACLISPHALSACLPCQPACFNYLPACLICTQYYCSCFIEENCFQTNMPLAIYLP
jgi:hypothetical protein